MKPRFFIIDTPINSNLYVYSLNNPIKYSDPDGNSPLCFIIYRDDNSKYSSSDKSFRGLDRMEFMNTETGERFNLYGVQSYVSMDGFSLGNTLEAYSGGFSIQYLGNNQESGQKLYGKHSSNYKGPVFNVQNANTKGLSVTNSEGQIIGDSDPTPIRVHSNYKLNQNRKVNMASGGCPMYNYEQGDDFAKFLEENGIKPGDTIDGYIKEYFEP